MYTLNDLYDDIIEKLTQGSLGRARAAAAFILGPALHTRLPPRAGSGLSLTAIIKPASWLFPQEWRVRQLATSPRSLLSGSPQKVLRIQPARRLVPQVVIHHYVPLRGG